MDTASSVAVAEGCEFDIESRSEVGVFKREVGGGRSCAVMKLSWGGSERVGSGRRVVVISDEGSLLISTGRRTEGQRTCAT